MRWGSRFEPVRPFNAVGEAVKGERMVRDVRQEYGCNLFVVRDQSGFGEARSWPQDLVEVGKANGAPVDEDVRHDARTVDASVTGWSSWSMRHDSADRSGRQCRHRAG